MAEAKTVYDRNGNERRTYINQPCGLLARDAVREMVMSRYCLKSGVPTNLLPFGVGTYDRCFYVVDGRKELMGTFVAGLFGTDARIEGITMSRRDKKVDRIPKPDADSILSNLSCLSEELNVDARTLLSDVIFKGVGKILRKMHSSGIVHGPRQSHLLNYTIPSGNSPIRVCDLGNAEFVTDMTNIQALKYMAYDLGLLAFNSSQFFNSVCSSILTKRMGSSGVLGGGLCQMALMMNDNPADYVFKGYTDDDDAVSPQNLGRENLPFGVVSKEWSRKIDAIKGKPIEFFKDARGRIENQKCDLKCS
jgi:hypothetical protein